MRGGDLKYLLKKSLHGRHIHRADQIEVHAVDPAFLDELAPLVERSNSWTLARNDGEIYVTVKDKTLTTRLERHPLSAGVP